MIKRSMIKLGPAPIIACMLGVSIIFSAMAGGQEIEDLKKQLAELKIVNQERLDKTKTAKELHELFYELRANEEGRIEKIVKHEEALKKHLSDGLLNEINKKIDQVMIFEAEDDEVIERATTFKQLNAVLDRLIEMQKAATADFNKENKRIILQVARYEYLISNKRAELEELQKYEQKYVQDKAGELDTLNEDMAAVKKRMEGKVDLKLAQEVSLFQQLLDRIEFLEAEIEKLKK